jgi:hypothetical protein
LVPRHLHGQWWAGVPLGQPQNRRLLAFCCTAGVGWAGVIVSSPGKNPTSLIPHSQRMLAGKQYDWVVVLAGEGRC